MKYFWPMNVSSQSLRRGMIIPVLVFVSGCSLFSKKDPNENSVDFTSQKKAAQEFEKGNVLMDSENYAGALEVFDKILVNHPVTTLDAMIMFNAGLSHLLLGECQEAEPQFRKVIRFTNKETPSLAIRARMKLSDALSCMGKAKESMVLLLEINKDRSRLPMEIGEAELPAKIAAAYSRNGNRKMADRYFSVAEMGLRKIQNQKGSDKDRRSLLAKTLFMMGDTSNVKKDMVAPEAYYQTLKVQQRYLLRSVEYDVKPWSQKAYDQLTSVYEQTWVFVSNIKPNQDVDETTNRRNLKVEKSNIVQMAIDGLRDLKGGKNLGVTATELVNQLFNQLSKQESKFNNFLVAEVPGTEYTSEAMKLQGPKREGRVESNPTVLEKNSKKKLKK